MNTITNGNQTHFEIIRDLIPIIGSLEEEEILSISVYKQKGETLFTWDTSKGTGYRSSELANALKKTYEEFNGRY